MRTKDCDLYTDNTIGIRLTKKQAYKLRSVLKDRFKTNNNINDFFCLHSLIDDIDDKI